MSLMGFPKKVWIGVAGWVFSSIQVFFGDFWNCFNLAMPLTRLLIALIISCDVYF